MKKAYEKKTMGGGVENKLNPTKSVFKPLIASSLALALVVSVASATAPSITTNSSSSDIGSSNNLLWTEYSSNSNIYKPINSGTAINTLTFHFTNPTQGGSDLTIGSTILSNVTTLNVNGNSNSIRMGDAGTGTLEFRFGSSQNKQATLDLSTITTSTNYALYGNLFIGGGSSSYIFTGNFGGKGISGNVSLDGQATSRLNFSGANAEISGNINLNAGTTTINSTQLAIGEKIQKTGSGTATLTFENTTDLRFGQIYTTNGATITLNFDTMVNVQAQKIEANINGPIGAKGTNNINFKKGAILNVTSNDGVYVYGGLNNITFDGTTSKIAGNITSRPDPYNESGINTINFRSTTSNTITGDIKAYSYGNNNYISHNIINFTAGDNIITGNINSEGSGTTINKINTSANSASLTINGKVTATSTQSGAGAKNTFNLSAGNNSINNSGKDAISAYGAFNEITFGGTGSSSITGNIKAEASNSWKNASNTITFGSSGTNEITGDIKATGFQNILGSNTIKFTAGTNTITGDISTIYAGTVGQNSITSTSGLTINGSVTANVGSNEITLSGTQNSTIQKSGEVIKANGGTNTITFSGTGTNSISGTITTGDTGGTNTIKFTNGTNNISGSISASSGENSITVNGSATSVAISANIVSGGNNYVNQGTNTISLTSSGSSEISGSITANALTLAGNTKVYGTNTISFSGAGTNTISGAITANSHGDATGSNGITFSAGSTNTISGNITADGGTNTIKFTADTTNKITSNTISASGGSNTISSTHGLALTDNQITASGGSNSITTNSISGSVEYIGASGGKNTLSATSDGDLAITKGIYTYNNGNDRGNRIALANGDLTIGEFTSNETSGYGDSNGNSLHAHNGGNSNTITLGKNGAVLSLAGNIYSGGANDTNNTINFNGTSGILKSSSGDSISASGKTNINITTLIIQGNNSGTGTLTTTGGTTTLTFKASVNGSLNGNITTTGGSTNLVLQDTKTYSITGTLSTSGAGKNNIDLSNKNVTISTDLNLSGSGITGENGNIITIGGSKTLTMNNGGSTPTIISTTGGKTYLNFNGASAGLSGNVSTSGGVTTINFKETNGTLTGAVSTSSSGTTEINITNGKNGSISGAVTASGTAMNVNFASGGNATTLALNGGNGTLSTTGGTTSINFNGSEGTFDGNITTTSSGSTIFNLGNTDGSSESIQATLDGAVTNTSSTHTFNINAKSATLKKGADALVLSNGENNINFENTSGAILHWSDASGATHAISTTGGTTNINFNQSGIIAGGVDTNSSNGGTTTITLANKIIPLGKNAESTAIHAQIQGAVTTTDGTTTIKFEAGENAKTLTLGASGNKISSITLADSSKATENNTLALSSGTTEIADKVTIASTQELAFDLNNGVELTLRGGLDNSGTNTFNFNGESATLALNGSGISTKENGSTIFNLGNAQAESVVAKITGTLSNTTGTSGSGNDGENFFAINAKNTTIQSDITFSAGVNVISFENTKGATLHWQDSTGGVNKAISTTGGITNINFDNSGTIAGGVSTTSAGTTNINVDNNAYAIIDGTLTTGDMSNAINAKTTPSTNVTLNSGTLVIKGANNKISNLILGDGNATLSLTDFNGSEEDNRGRRNIVIDTLTTGSGELTLATRTTASSADTFTITNISGNKQGTYRFGISLDGGVSLNEVGANNAILVASVANNTNTITFENTAKVVGDVIEGVIEIDSRENGGNTDYYLGKILNANIILAEQAVTATAFTLNYDLYMANFNSLNKRMGELRENAHSQGVWARVFNGAQTNTQGLGSKSNYTTIQAGYDYAFGFEGANNYLGVALSYALSTSTADTAFDSNGHTRSIDNIYSNAVEVAVYNSYVSDMGWYNDSIAKFSYLMSSFDIDRAGGITSNNTTNFAFTLGDEVGYKFALGEDKEWGITPQLEATFGYFNQSDFKQTLQSQSTINSMADSVLTLRTRVGSSFSYDFKRFTQDKGFNANLYLGLSYEYDYVEGGNVTMDTNAGIQSNELSDISSDGRVVMNVGTNMSVKDNTRIYFDFEKSFAGKITTDYQVNVGVRYSFGESNGYAPKVEKAEFKAPLKVEGEESKEENTQTQESKENVETQESAKDSQNTSNSQEQKESTTEDKAQ